MELSGLRLRRAPRLVQATLCRPEARNALDSRLLRELAAALDEAERDPGCRALVLAGEGGSFCTGMDFAEAAGAGDGEAGAFRAQAAGYMALLRRFAETRLIVVAKVEGLAAGGGVGLAAASDLVVATPESEFQLPEALWGLLPCCVLPWLVRRTGFHPAYRMALTTQSLGAEAARDCRLVDEVSAAPDEAVRRLLLRSLRVEAPLVGELKRYAGRLWSVSAETERQAVEELCRLVARPEARAALAAFVEEGVYPWERPPEGKAR